MNKKPDINKMDKKKLLLFTKQLFISKPQMKLSEFEATLKECDKRMDCLRSVNDDSALVVFSEGDLG